MFNFAQFNTSRFNVTEKLVYSVGANITDRFRFGNIGLHHIDGTDDYIQVIRDDCPIPTRVFNTTQNPRTNGKKIVNSVWDERKIFLDVEVCKPTEEELDLAIDTLKGVLTEEEGILQMIYKGEYREFNATLTNTAFGKRLAFPRNVEVVNLEFTCIEDPFGRDIAYTTDTTNNITQDVYQDIFYNSGSTKTPLYLKFYFTDANAITNISVVNETNGDTIEITDAPADSEILVIDPYDEAVELQGNSVPFGGSFIYLERGSNEVTITVTSTAHDYNLSYKFKNLYL